MTEETLRHLDNDDLHAVAYDLGLAPLDVFPLILGTGRRIFLRHGPAEVALPNVAWSPATVRADAAACLDVVRARGYATSTTWEAEYTTAQEEAHAILLCAVLAVYPREVA